MNSVQQVLSALATSMSVTYSCSASLVNAAGSPQDFLSRYSALSVGEEALFLQHGDNWIIRYQGQHAVLKASRGLDYLALLLCHPGREFHVSELHARLGRPC